MHVSQKSISEKKGKKEEEGERKRPPQRKAVNVKPNPQQRKREGERKSAEKSDRHFPPLFYDALNLAEDAVATLLELTPCLRYQSPPVTTSAETILTLKNRVSIHFSLFGDRLR